MQKVVDTFGRLDILVNNAGEQHPDEDIRDITEEQLKRTFQTNIYSMFYHGPGRAPAPQEGRGDHQLHLDHHLQGQRRTCSIIRRPRARSPPSPARCRENLVDDGIRVNAVAPGPIWTPLNPCGGQPPEEIPDFGKDTPMGRPGQPNEVAPAFLFLACEDSSYMAGQVLHPNGGTVVNG